MNRIFPTLFITLMLSACATTPETVEVKIPVPVVTPCNSNVPKPGMCVPKDDSRVEFLRCVLIDRERQGAYVKALEGALEACR